jgi:hypothetical protein
LRVGGGLWKTAAGNAGPFIADVASMRVVGSREARDLESSCASMVHGAMVLRATSGAGGLMEISESTVSVCEGLEDFNLRAGGVDSGLSGRWRRSSRVGGVRRMGGR